jgi:hypothetical protein
MMVLELRIKQMFLAMNLLPFFFSFYTSEEQVCVLPHETNEF